MAVCRILQLGDPLLRNVSRPVAEIREAAPVLADLRDTLHEFQIAHGFGRGIAAVQIGALLRVIYIEFRGRAYCLINPEAQWLSPETFTLWDDCFSFPDLLVKVARSGAARITYLDEFGTPQIIEAGREFAELLQHELDHLDGILAIDRALDRDSFCTRREHLRRAEAGLI